MKRFTVFILLSFFTIASCSLLGSGGGNDKGDKKEPDITRPIVFAAIDSAGTGRDLCHESRRLGAKTAYSF
ncbi:MAG: hypothetical protein U5J95_08285 [Balneolaceae bacterium]|nr:hypothetical protein [Balneolaceae bacterium]